MTNKFLAAPPKPEEEIARLKEWIEHLSKRLERRDIQVTETEAENRILRAALQEISQLKAADLPYGTIEEYVNWAGLEAGEALKLLEVQKK